MARLFCAVVPPLDLVEHLDAFLAVRRDAEPRLRWTRPDSWHLTTAFAERVDQTHLDRLVENLATAAARTPRFRIRLDGGGAFPWPREAKALWLGVGEGSDGLTALAARCRNAACHAGVRVDKSPVVPHLTVARAHRAIDATRLVRVLDSFTADPFVAAELVLFESHLRDRANRYEVLERFPLPHPGPAMPAPRPSGETDGPAQPRAT